MGRRAAAPKPNKPDKPQKKAEPKRAVSEPSKPIPSMQELTPEEQAVVRILQAGETDFDALCAQTGIASDALGALLMLMEMDGLIAPKAGRSYALA